MPMPDDVPEILVLESRTILVAKSDPRHHAVHDVVGVLRIDSQLGWQRVLRVEILRYPERRACATSRATCRMWHVLSPRLDQFTWQ